MGQMSNLDALFKAQLQAVRKAFEESGEDEYDYKDQLLRVLGEPALPLPSRIT